MFKKLGENYRKLSTSNKIGLSVTINMVIMVLMISSALYIEFINVKNSQEELPGSFFATYHQESLQQVSMRAKQLILTLVDSRVPFISSVTNLLVDHSNQTILHNDTTNLRPQNTTSYTNKVMCVRTQTQTIFSCNMDQMARFLMEGGWPYHSQRRIKNARRFTIIYQNIQNPSDIMIFTISYTQDLQIKNIDRINQQMNSIKDGFLQFSSFYPDQYGTSTQQLVSFHTKKTFNKYMVLVQVQTFGGFIKLSITRVIYSDDTNVVVITKNESQTNGYSLVTNLKPLQPNIQYKNLLKPGHHQSLLPDGQIVYSYTITISSIYQLGHVSLAQSQNVNQGYSLIIHTPSISLKAETRTFEIINNLKQKLFQFQTTFSFYLFLLLGANVLRLANQINRKLKIIQQSMKKYSENPSNYHQTAKQLINESQNQYWFGSVMNAISQTIKAIQCNKRKFRQKCQKRSKDQFPLNILDPKFIQQEGWKQFQKFDELIERLEASSPVGKGLKTIKQEHEQLKKYKEQDQQKKR